MGKDKILSYSDMIDIVNETEFKLRHMNREEGFSDTIYRGFRIVKTVRYTDIRYRNIDKNNTVRYSCKELDLKSCNLESILFKIYDFWNGKDDTSYKEFYEGFKIEDDSNKVSE